jgi:hypothetical protein
MIKFGTVKISQTNIDDMKYETMLVLLPSHIINTQNYHCLF